MPTPVALSALGIAKEVTPGTPVAPTHFIPYTSNEPNDDVAVLADTGVRGSMVDEYGSVPGPRSSTYGVGGNVHPDVFGFILASMLPDVATTGASAPFTHTFATKNTGDGQPTSYTLTDWDGVAARAFPGCKASSLEIEFSADDLLKFSGEFSGYKSATASAPTKSFTAVDPQAVWALAVTVGGSAVPIETGSLSLTRPVSVLNTADGTQDPYKVFAGPLSVEGSMTLIHEVETELDRYRDGTKPAMVLNLQVGAGAALVQVQFTMSKVSYREGRKTRGADWLQTEIGFKAEANTTDIGASLGYGQVKAQLKNAIAAGVYV